MYVKHTISRAVIPFLAFAACVYAWRAEIIESDAGDRLRDIVKHSSGALVAVGDDGTIVRSGNNGRTWKKVDLPRVAGFFESNNISFRSIVELPRTHELVTVGAVYEQHSHSSGPAGPGSTGGSITTYSVEKWSSVLVSGDGGISWKLSRKIDGAALYWAKVTAPDQSILQGYSDSIYLYQNGDVAAYSPTTLTAKLNKHTEYGVFGKRTEMDGHSPNMIFGLILGPYKQDRVLKYFRDKMFTLENEKSIAVSIDSGKTWVPVTKVNENSPEIRSFDVLNENTLAAVCKDGILLLTVDAGLTWEKKKISDENLNDVHFQTATDWWVAGDNGFLARSSNNGKSFTQLPVNSRKDLYTIVIEEDGINGWSFGKGGLLVHVYDERKADSFLEGTSDQDSTDARNLPQWNSGQTWEGRVVSEKAEWYSAIHKGGSVGQGLYLETTPDSVTVVIDAHTYINNGKLLVSLPTGKHSVAVSKEGYFVKNDSFEVEVGKVEKKGIALRRIKFLVSPSGFLGFLNNNASPTRSTPVAGFSLMAGLLTYKRFVTGFCLDAGLGLLSTSTINIDAIVGHRFEPGLSFHVTPFAGFGLQENFQTLDSIKRDTTGTGAGGAVQYDTIPDGAKHQIAGVSLQAGIDMNFRKKNSRWGFTIRPAVIWAPGINFSVLMRLGVIFWLL